MLARYLARAHQRPIRYALDPAHAQALRNFLLFQTRARNMPALAQGLGPATQHPLVAQLLHEVMGGQDHEAVGPLHDLLHDQGAPTQGHGGRFLQYLSNMHRIASGRDARVPQDVLQRHYGNLHTLDSVFGGEQDSEAEAERKYNLGQAVRGTVDPIEGDVYDLLRHLTGTPHFDAVRRGRTEALGGTPMALPGLYDALHAASGHPAVTHMASGMRDALAHDMRNVFLPTLHRGV
jgi:hypothetical protein